MLRDEISNFLVHLQQGKHKLGCYFLSVAILAQVSSAQVNGSCTRSTLEGMLAINGNGMAPPSKRARICRTGNHCFDVELAVAREIQKDLLDDKPGVVNRLCTWIATHPHELLSSEQALSSKWLCQDALKLVQGRASLSEQTQEESIDRLVELVELLVVLSTTGRKTDLCDELVCLVGQCASALMKCRPESALSVSDADEWCLLLLSSKLWGVCVDSKKQLDILEPALDVFSYCRWWSAALMKMSDPVKSASCKTVRHFQDVCMAVFSNPSYTLGDLACAGMLRNAHYFPTVAFGHALSVKAVKECTTLTKKLMVIRGGIFVSVWIALTHVNGDGPTMYNHKTNTAEIKQVFAWCYPQGNVFTLDALSLRQALLQEIAVLEQCARYPPKYYYVKEFLLGNNKERLDQSSLTARASFIRDFLDKTVSAHEVLPDALQTLSRRFSDCLSLEAPKLLMEDSDDDDSDHDVEDSDDDDSDHDEVEKKSLWLHLRHESAYRFLLATHPILLSFATKHDYLKTLIEHVKDSGGDIDPIVLVVPRTSVTDGVCRRLGIPDTEAGTSGEPLKGLLQIEFRDEDGQDQDGLLRAWLELAGRHFIQSDLFVAPSEDATHLSESGVSADRRRLHGLRWSPASTLVCQAVQKDWEAQFLLLGSIIGFALMHNEQLPIKFTRNFIRSLLQRPVVAVGLHLEQDCQSELSRLLTELALVDKTLASKLDLLAKGEYSVFGVDTLASALEAAGLPKTFTFVDSRDTELTGRTELVAKGRIQLKGGLFLLFFDHF